MDTGLDFDQARAKHIAFKTNLRAILYGAATDHAPVLSHYECGVGKWIYGHALAAYGHIPEMEQLERVHADIHTCARLLVALYEQGRVDEAREGLTGMELIADNLVALLSIAELRINAVHGKGGASPEYEELKHLHKTIHELDARIREQTELSVTAKRVAEKYEHKFRDTVMQAPVGMVILRGRDMIVEMANATYLAIVDRQAETFTGISLFTSLPEVRETVEPILLNILATGEPFYGNEFEVTLNRFGKKEQAFFNFVYHPLRDSDQAINGIIAVATDVTGQVKSKLALQQRELQFRKLVTQSPIAMAIFRGPEHIIELANDTLLKNIWRKELADVEGRKLMDVFPELREQQFPELMKHVLDTGHTYKQNEAVAMVNSYDGLRKYYLDFEYAPLFEPDGSVSGIMVTVNDVTEKVQARQQIENAEKRYRALIETLPVAVFTVDKDGYLDLYNQAAVNLWARVPVKGEEKWCGSHGLYSLEGALVPHEICPMATALRENRPIHTEAYVERPDGTLRHVIAHPQPMHDTEGQVTGAMNVLIDITDRIAAEAALRSSEEKFRVLANFMPQFIWTAQPEGNLDYFSQSVFDYSGFTEERLFKEGWLEIVHPDDRQQNIDLWVTSITTGQPFHYEHRFRRHDGEYRWQLSRAVPQKDEAGNITMWVGTSTDIHDRRIFSDELTRKVDERTRELKQSNEHLVRSNAELTQFNYVASHDLQEPLRKIQTFVSRILEMDADKLSVKSKDYFDRIQKSSQRTRQLIRDLLAFSRANTAEKHFELTDLTGLVHKVKEDLQEHVEQRQATIAIATLPVIPVIRFQLEQLFTNLITNSIKFAKQDTAPNIAISAAVISAPAIKHINTEATGAYHHISYTDNGIGFDPEFNERIFLVFQRLHTRDAYEGTGIGLAICKRIAENHNGYMTAHGQEGAGARFDIYLPAVN